MTLKLYVWEDVLTNFRAGIIVVLAESEEDAFELVKQNDPVAWWEVNGKPMKRTISPYGGMFRGSSDCDTDYKGIHPNAIHPRIVEAPEAFVMWGGD